MRSPLELLEHVRKALADVSRAGASSKYPPPETLLSWFRDRKKTIRDPIYDQIALNDLERAVLRTPEFQRLRWIRQMDFAYLVYPAAEHSRLVHSLGVCQAAKELFDRVVGSHDDKLFQTAPVGTVQAERESVPDFCLFDRVLVSLAALLHDLAHPAFSHAFDVRDDLVKHDDYERNPFMLRALFDTSSSKLAKVLARWDPFFRVLVRAEAPQLFPESAHTEEGMTVAVPCLATLVFEILSIPAADDLGDKYVCICPGTEEKELSSNALETVARTGWERSSLEFAKRTVRTSHLFRRLHCDIVANTISADLLDYIRRDTRLAGLPRDLDRRFYSYISSGEYRDRQRVVVELQDRQGHVRRDALSDLMNCMEIRYIIHERIVLHRAAVAARSMAARLYPPIKLNPLRVWPVVEKMYGEWGKWRSDAEVLSPYISSKDIDGDMAALLRNRFLYRPIVILDAERLRRHNVTLTEDAKKRLAAKFGGLSEAENSGEWSRLLELEQSINQGVLADNGAAAAKIIKNQVGDSPISFAVCMKPSVLFKTPRILVRVPTSLPQRQADTDSHVEVLDLWLSQVIPLNAHEGDQGIYDQIRALNTRYRELWRLYVFAHPRLFENRIGQVLLAQLKARWEEAIRVEAAIPAIPPNISADDLKSQDVIDRLEDQRWPELLAMAVNLFPAMGLSEAERVLERTDLDAAYKKLKSRKDEVGIAGTAAKAKGSSSTDEGLRGFQAFLKDTIVERPKQDDLFGTLGGANEPKSSK